MDGRGPQAGQGLAVLLCAIALVAGKAVARIASVQLDHQPIPPYFGHYARGGDRETESIAARDALLGDGKCRKAEEVNEEEIGDGGELGNGLPHGQAGSRHNAYFVNRIRRHNP